jgi:hypothetical protein
LFIAGYQVALHAITSEVGGEEELNLGIEDTFVLVRTGALFAGAAAASSKSDKHNEDFARQLAYEPGASSLSLPRLTSRRRNQRTIDHG